MTDNAVKKEIEKEAVDGDGTSIFQSAVVISVASIVAKATGFLRTWAMAFALGNTILAAGYQLAFSLPDMIYELVAGGFLTVAFLPVFMSVRAREGEKRSWLFASNVFNIVLLILGLVSLIATFLAPQVVATQTFTSEGETVDLAIFFFRFFAIQILFYGLSAIVNSLLNARRSYFIPAFSSVFNNVVVIITMLGFAPIASINPDAARVWLAVGTTLGCFAMLACQIPALLKKGARYHFHIDFHDPALKELLHIAIPLLAFVISGLIATSFSNAYALKVAENAPASIQYSRVWYQLPYGIVVVAIATVLFTELSDYAAQKKWEQFNATLITGLKTTLFFITPLSVLLMVLATPLVTLYHAGEFTQDDIQIVAQLLFWWGINLPFYAAYSYFYRVFSSLKDLGSVTVAIVALRIPNIIGYIVFTCGLGSFEGFGLIGIPISDALYSLCVTIVYVVMLRKKVGPFLGASFPSFCLKVLLASCVAGGVSAVLYWSFFAASYSIGMAIVALFVCGISGLVAFYYVAKLMKIPEVSLVQTLLRRPKRKTIER